jgi:hypothetical protein
MPALWDPPPKACLNETLQLFSLHTMRTNAPPQYCMEDLVKAIRRVRGIDYPQSQAPLLDAEKDARMRRFRADVQRFASRAASSIMFIIVR